MILSRDPAAIFSGGGIRFPVFTPFTSRASLLIFLGVSFFFFRSNCFLGENPLFRWAVLLTFWVWDMLEGPFIGRMKFLVSRMVWEIEWLGFFKLRVVFGWLEYIS